MQAIIRLALACQTITARCLASTAMQNRYWLLRHGRSKANEAQLIVSSMDNGVKQEYALAEAGRQQVLDAGKRLAAELAALGVAQSDLLILSSPFSRTLETAALVACSLGRQQGLESIKVASALRERYFGAALELTSHDNYCPAWEHDAADCSYRPGGDGESVEHVAARIRQLFQELEAAHRGRHILLVGHGDTLSILQAAMLGTPLGQHRQYGLGTAELKRLN